MIRVILPQHLRTLAGVTGEVSLELDGDVTQRSVLDALEERYPVLCGTIRDQQTKRSCGFLRARRIYRTTIPMRLCQRSSFRRRSRF